MILQQIERLYSPVREFGLEEVKGGCNGFLAENLIVEILLL